MLIVVSLILVVVAVGFAAVYNSLAKMRNTVRTAWSDIDVYLKRRADLIPALVETTKGYSGFESDTLEAVTRMRSGVADSSLPPGQRAKAVGDLEGRLISILAIAEQYPELKASANFLKLQEELTDTEGLVANARRYYNAAVRDYNTMIHSFPSGLVAALGGFRPAEFFSIEDNAERNAPQIGLG